MKRILVVNHFPVVNPPISGGTLRYFHLYKELSRYYDITLLSQTKGRKEGLFHYTPSFREYKVRKDSLFDEVRRKLPSSIPLYELGLIVNMELAKHDTTFKKQFERFYETSDLIIHESPFLLGYDRFLGIDGKPRIYNSHNHEYHLASQLWKDENSKAYLPDVFKLEQKLGAEADLIFTTSETERNSFIKVYKAAPAKVKLAPNGIHPGEWLPPEKNANEKPVGLFIGSEYPPNIDAAGFIVNELANKCPKLDFVIAGGCSNPFSKISRANVQLLGRIPHQSKLRLIASSNFALNPMFTGAGINIKTLEFLSAGLPLFSTAYGMRGLNAVAEKHYIPAQKNDFAEKLNQSVHNEKRLSQIALSGQQYINKNYSWQSIAKKMQNDMAKTLNF
ncbi:glycosyltransferase family 4 protein [Bacillus sp. ISL-47]|uniref:glycosyltransferase family 4 protein n=1 Tax=Bacillus sp. ISL-47 TaxID=2819130 RepID=UPI001BE77C08|nr:glycosyltransferase family 4 protein [Bacillus sp. ISL-47]MBT2689115.1 glycosyltransferase family 4 protein [Bacillus sp. ISL-47]MBT2708571.1 glycosyltransferase family 4 protein [Pseudomonas sp. ISL-84]